MKEIIIATLNSHKFQEISSFFKKLPFVKLSKLPQNFELPEENGLSFYENVLIKAKFVYDKFKKTVIADDSGLVIPSLDGFPGIFSSRFAKKMGGFENAMKKIIELLRGKSSFAKFVCYAVLYLKDNEFYVFRGEVEGFIVNPRGNKGFGYDPIFLYPQFGRTFGEIPYFLKDRVSHRGKAMRQLIDKLKELHKKGRI